MVININHNLNNISTTLYDHKEEISIILCTFPNDMPTVVNIIKNLLNSKLAACITVLKDVHSFFYWQEKFEQQSEIQLIIKTKKSLQQKILNEIKTHHPYQIPELLVIPVTNGDADYLHWINTTLN